jgi:hypothetical protein
LARKSDAGFELNFIPCESGCVAVNDLENLKNMTASAISHFSEKEFAKVEKTSDLER